MSRCPSSVSFSYFADNGRLSEQYKLSSVNTMRPVYKEIYSNWCTSWLQCYFILMSDSGMPQLNPFSRISQINCQLLYQDALKCLQKPKQVKWTACALHMYLHDAKAGSITFISLFTFYAFFSCTLFFWSERLVPGEALLSTSTYQTIREWLFETMLVLGLLGFGTVL